MLKKEIMDFMEEFHQRGKLSKGMGASFIALIPKKVGDLGIKDYRPISLLGSLYKILSKVLARRIQKVMLKVISIEQWAFVKRTQILGDIPVANECVHSRLKERLPGIICKLDLEKAYDRVDWKFLQYMLRRMGFGEKWRMWIRECISSAWFSMLVNGSPKGYFPAERELRQGDPLSPFLFLIVAEALGRMVRQSVQVYLKASKWLEIPLPSATYSLLMILSYSVELKKTRLKMSKLLSYALKRFQA